MRLWHVCFVDNSLLVCWADHTMKHQTAEKLVSKIAVATTAYGDVAIGQGKVNRLKNGRILRLLLRLLTCCGN